MITTALALSHVLEGCVCLRFVESYFSPFQCDPRRRILLCVTPPPLLVSHTHTYARNIWSSNVLLHSVALLSREIFKCLAPLPLLVRTTRAPSCSVDAWTPCLSPYHIYFITLTDSLRSLHVCNLMFSWYQLRVKMGCSVGVVSEFSQPRLVFRALSRFGGDMMQQAILILRQGSLT